MEGPRVDEDEGASAERFGSGIRTSKLRPAAMRCARERRPAPLNSSARSGI